MLAVDDISLTLCKGEVLGFLGPNGSGKSTTMKMMTGFLTPNSGSVEICGIDIQTNPVAAQRQLGYLPEGAPAYFDISTSDYLSFIADIRQFVGASKQRAIAYVVERTNITEVLHQPIGTLSKGYKRRVGLAQALLHNPDVLILDEPTDGLDPNQKHEVRSLIREISPDKAIIISTHILEEVDSICDRTLVIADGRIVSSGTPEELEQRSRYYNAVSLTLPSSVADQVRVELGSLPDVMAVEVNAGVNNIDSENIELVVLPENGADILPAITPQVYKRSWGVQQIQRQRVPLDEVFRELTAADNKPDNHITSLGADSALSENESVEDTASTRESEQPLSQPVSQLRDTWAICRNELNGYFSTPLAYVFVIIFLVTLGAFTFFLGGFFTQGQASLEGFFQFHPWLYLFLIPAIAMRLWAEERKSGSIEVLLTLPVTRLSAVVGKFLAAWLIIGLGLLLTMTIWLTVNYLGSPDNGAIAAAYLGSFIMAGAYLAIGAFVSATTSNQVIAFIIAAAVSFIFTASGLGIVLEFFSDWASPVVLDVVANFSFLEHFRGISRGVVDVRDVVFFISTIVFFLFANIVVVERSKHA